MTPVTDIYLYTGPAVSVIFAAAFLGAWLFQRSRRYILLFTATFLTFAMASLSQMLGIPSDTGHNTMVAGTLYTLAILFLIKGVWARLGVKEGELLLFLIAAILMALKYYFFYIQRDLVMRIYVQHFGFGLMFLVAAVCIARAGPQRGLDRLIFWLILIFGLHFFPRTILTMSVSQEIYSMDASRPGFDMKAAGPIFRHSPFWQVLNFTLLISTFLISLTLLGAVVGDVIEELRREGAVDPLTGIANRRSFLVRAEAAASRSPEAMSVVYCDVDHFKSINDRFGHAAGDRVLVEFALLLEAKTRPRDVAARLGGEEFVVLLPRTGRRGAAELAERLRQAVELTRFSGLPNHVTVTASFGVAEWRTGEQLIEVMHRADRMLYAAKRNGRNQVAVDTELMADEA